MNPQTKKPQPERPFRMNKTLIAVTLGCALGSVPAFAESFSDSAPVLSVRPVTERTPVNRQECWNEQRRGYEDRVVTRQDNGAPIGAGTVIGAIAGGLVGNQIDRQNANDPGPGSEVERVPVTRDVERCRTVQEVREVAVGYDVRYRYGNREFVTRMPFDPGGRIRINV